jgi:hypothetical protein
MNAGFKFPDKSIPVLYSNARRLIYYRQYTAYCYQLTGGSKCIKVVLVKTEKGRILQKKNS